MHGPVGHTAAAPHRYIGADIPVRAVWPSPGAVVSEAMRRLVLLWHLVALHGLGEVAAAVPPMLAAAWLVDVSADVHLLPLDDAKQPLQEPVGGLGRGGDPGGIRRSGHAGRHARPDLAASGLSILVVHPEDDVRMDGPASGQAMVIKCCEKRKVWAVPECRQTKLSTRKKQRQVAMCKAPRLTQICLD